MKSRGESRVDKCYYGIYNGSIMSKAVINFKVDVEVKKASQKLAKELGMPLSTIINSQLKELLRTRTLSVSAIPRMTPFLENILDEVEEDRLKGRNISPAFSSVEEMFEHLNSTK